MKRILVTGASGFIGSFIVEEALRRGFETWAAVRQTSSKRYLKDERIRFIELDFNNSDSLEEALSKVEFDYIVHAAGLTKTTDKNDFYRVNTDGTRRLAAAVVATNHHLKRFVFLSSLSVMGAIRENQPYEAIRSTDHPHPNTHYGRSKLMAEEALQEIRVESKAKGKEFDYIVLRPTGVYGPREKDYMMMVDSIRQHVDFAVGYQPQDITFIYVSDVVDAIFLALEGGETGEKYLLSDGEVYQSATFSRLIKKELGNPFCLRIVSPIWLLRIITMIGDLVGRIRGKVTALNSDKFHILRQRNWRADINPAIRSLGFSPKVKLEEGVKNIVRYYEQQHLRS